MRSFPDLRRVFLAASLCGAVALAGCSEGPVDVPVAPTIIVDAEPAWSHDGTTLAFTRADSSSYGPPGIYVMSWPGMAIRLVRELDPEGIRGLRFSGDDQSLIAGWSGALVRIDVISGTQTTIPVGTTSASLPDETSDGSAIAYVRPSSPNGTLWQYEPAVPRDSVIRIDGAVSDGSFPRYSPGDSILVYAEDDGLHWLRRGTGQGFRFSSTNSSLRHTIPRWLDERRVLFNEVSSSGQRYFIADRFTGNRVEVPLGIFESEAVSPAGDSIIVQGYDNTDPNVIYVVLYVRGITSNSSTARQITRYLP